ncbi:DUF1850 domain-containing protein [Pseudaminobacter salicylatoxidans]|uniref:DUF1850 domain-containing protein n=1 Tax=Pseudaminobacter salicylatoxidans TaxID=93369 RepID=UPI00031ACF51|nr:DUF1850 domain-containing protein [Pseudaminobacter salicylatoxidans]
MSICILAGGKLTVLAAAAFTLSWTHSVEKTRWQESWQVTPAGQLRIVEARVEGSGAGMDPPEGSVMQDGWWVYVPAVPVQQQIVLASSGATGAGWSLCTQERCLVLGEARGAPVTLSACDEAAH